MRGVFLFCFLLALPVLAAAGHDIYKTYMAFEEGDWAFGQPLRFYEVGKLWVDYGPETYDWARENIEPERWESYVDPVLRQPALLVTALPAGISYAALIILKLLGLWPFSGSGLFKGKSKEKKGFAFGGTDKKSGPIKYKRK
jgi:hypothetical protein